jgi:hypothetical protein
VSPAVGAGRDRDRAAGWHGAHRRSLLQPLITALRWVGHWAPLLRNQLARRAAHPASKLGRWANGAIEDSIQTAREVIGDRAWPLRNRTPLNLLLELVRLRINKLDSQIAYASAVRKHLDSTGGRPTHSAAIADQDDADGRRAYSLRA